jgi:hypothetical protein
MWASSLKEEEETKDEHEHEDQRHERHCVVQGRAHHDDGAELVAFDVRADHCGYTGHPAGPNTR